MFAFGFQGDVGMPLGMASLLTAPLVADKMADDSVRTMSFNWLIREKIIAIILVNIEIASLKT